MRIIRTRQFPSFGWSGLIGMLVLLSGLSWTQHAAGQQKRSVQDLSDLRKLSDQIVSMSQRCVDATVAVISANAAGAGSGVIVDESGLILTAAHVVAATGDDVFIVFGDGTRRKGKCTGADFDRDAAMIQLEVREGDAVPFVDVAESDLSTRNEWCVAIGHPGGFDPTRTAPLRLGRVLGVERSNGAAFLRTDSAIVGGDSGGPLFNLNGQVVGIHSNIGASLSQNRHVPISAFHDFWDEMKDGKRRGRRFSNDGGIDPNRPVLGTQLENAPSKGGGIAITSLFENSPAQKAGLRVGDLITAINDKETESRDALIDAVSRFKAGDKVTVWFRREEKKQSVEVTLGKLSDLAPPQNNGPSAPNNNRRRPPLDEQKDAPDKDSEAPTEDCDIELPEVRLVFQDKKENPDSSDESLDKFIDDVLNGTGANIDDDAVARFGSKARILERLQEKIRQKIAAPKQRATQRQRSRTQTVLDEFFQSCLDALEPITLKAAESTVEVLVNGEPVVLGTVVTADGMIVTKDTETKSGKIAVRLGEEVVDAELVERFASRDLALFRVDRKGLQAIEWIPEDHPAPIGSLLTAADKDGEPLGIGLVSVLPRTLSNVGYLGIQTGFVDGGGVLVGLVTSDSAAERCGMKSGDIIKSLNGKVIDSPIDFSYQIQKHRAGEEVEIGCKRGDEELTFTAKLGARSVGGGGSARARRMNEMSGPLSERDSGFPEALQHDIPLLPSDCGGPLMDLDGRCIGINVSRAGRVKTYAIPASDIRAMLSELAVELSLP